MPVRGKIAVAGATGKVGRHVIDVLTEQGHPVVPISRAQGVNVISGSGLAAALAGADCIIDVTGGPSPEQEAATTFFTTAARNLQQAGERAGVTRYVAVSIIGIQKSDGGYGSAKLAHEQAVLAGPVPARILRVAQFHELVEMLMDMSRQGEVIYLPEMRTQVIAARTVAEGLAAMATSPRTEFAAAQAAESAGTPIPKLAGPREENLASLARLVAARRSDPVRIEEVNAGDRTARLPPMVRCSLDRTPSWPGRHSKNGSLPSQTAAAQRKHRCLAGDQVIRAFRAGRTAVRNDRPSDSQAALCRGLEGAERQQPLGQQAHSLARLAN